MVEKRLCGRVQVSEQQFGFMPGRCMTDVCFALKQLMEGTESNNWNYMVCSLTLRKLMTGYQGRTYGTA